MKAGVPILILILSGLNVGCGVDSMEDRNRLTNPLDNVPTIAWERLAETRIFFGHQSVGFNIVAGVKEVMREDPRIRLNIVETTEPSSFNSPIFAHSRVGKNGDPDSKFYSFGVFIENGIGSKVDIAFLKMCYADVSNQTDVSKMFDRYKRTMASLKIKYPGTKFVHVTIPLVSTDTSFKQFVKRLIGRKDVREYANVNRSRFNELLQKEYGGREPIFDLARIETTSPDGKRRANTYEGKIYYSMQKAYTSDGGHLNELGRKIVAREFLAFLAALTG